MWCRASVRPSRPLPRIRTFGMDVLESVKNLLALGADLIGSSETKIEIFSQRIQGNDMVWCRVVPSRSEAPWGCYLTSLGSNRMGLSSSKPTGSIG